MRWLKHLTKSRFDEKLSSLIDHFGYEGYGRWWAILEIVAEQMDASQKTSVTYSARAWTKMLRFTDQNVTRSLLKCNKLVKFLSQVGLILLQIGKNDDVETWEVNIPNILKYRDEYSQRQKRDVKKYREFVPTLSGVYPDQDTDTELDTDIKETLSKESCSVGSQSDPTKPQIDPKLSKCLLDTVHFKILADGKNEKYWDTQVAAFEETYPWFNLEEEIRKADAWCAANPTKKPKTNLKSFLTRWFNKALEIRRRHEPKTEKR